MTTEDPLPSWKESPARRAIVDFVAAATRPGSADYVQPADRIAVFDNDGTLWCERPLPIELGFILRRLADMTQEDPSLRGRQPWTAACDRDVAWLAGAVTRHYAGDDTDVKVLLGGVVRAFAGWPVERYVAAADAFVRDERHPTLGRTFRECGYGPMVELLRFLEKNGFDVYIASGGSRDFMRAFAEEMYGISAERVIGSTNALRFREADGEGTVVYEAEPDVFDDGPAKPVRIWSRIGRRPVIAVGNANGDIPMLRFADCRSRPGLQILVLHDDAEREFDYRAGAEEALGQAKARGWTIVSMKNDWIRIFAEGLAPDSRPPNSAPL